MDSVTDPDRRGVTVAQKPKMPAGPNSRRRQVDMLVREHPRRPSVVSSHRESALVAAGKPKLIALVAVARKLITILNAILRDRRSWQQISA